MRKMRKIDYILEDGPDTSLIREFGEYLNECCEYMLAYGDPI